MTMTLTHHEFIRRFMMHVLPKGFHRIRHYSLLANGNRVAMVAEVRELLRMAPSEQGSEAAQAAGPATSSFILFCTGRAFLLSRYYSLSLLV
jgi:hypothetical protein